MSNEISDEGRHAARALAQWELGDPEWGSRILRCATAPNPKEYALNYIPDEVFDEVWKESR